MNELVEPRGNASSAVPFPSQLKKDRCRCSRVTQGQVGGQQELLRARSGGGKNFDLGLAASQVTRNDAAEISKVIAEGNSNRTLGHGQEFDGALAVLDLSDRRSRGTALLKTNALDPKGRRRSNLQINPWLLRPGPGLCRSGICRLEFCRRATYQLARSGQPAADEGGPQQPPFLPKPKTQCQRLQIST